jgi:hypothetical protein
MTNPPLKNGELGQARQVKMDKFLRDSSRGDFRLGLRKCRDDPFPVKYDAFPTPVTCGSDDED